MSGTEREPTRAELEAMAYVDGELDPAAARSFEEQMITSSELTLEVAQLRGLAVLARNAAGPEPMDAEWEQLERDPLHQGTSNLGYAALLVSAVGLVALVLYGTFQSDLHLAAKVVVFAGIGGFLLLFFTTLRARLRTLPYDPYKDVHR